MRALLRMFFLIAISSVFVLAVGANTDYHKKDCFCKLKEYVDDCDCGVEMVHEYNNVHVFPIIKSLVEMDYFRFFPVNLHRPCRFWPDDSRCSLRDCHVKGCSIEEIPLGLRPSSESLQHVSVLNTVDGKENSEICPVDENAGGLGNIDLSLSDNTKEAIKSWTLHDDKEDKFCETDDELPGNVEYVDLLKNPERFTGYQGHSANRIWQVIYKENCFSEETTDHKSQFTKERTQQCLEKRVFHRLISGLHTSITVHLCYDYLLKRVHGYLSEWGPKKEEFVKRFHPQYEPEGPQRLKNLYFIYLLQLRALIKAAPYLTKETFYTGNEEADINTRQMMKDLLQAAGNFMHHFDESRLFREGSPEEIAHLKSAFRSRFRNITRIMDCVGCDKCKLWGKLQVQGLGTALKILFSSDDLSPHSTVPQIELESGRKFQLRRTEIVALINAFSKLSKSIYAVGVFQDMLSG